MTSIFGLWQSCNLLRPSCGSLARECEIIIQASYCCLTFSVNLHSLNAAFVVYKAYLPQKIAGQNSCLAYMGLDVRKPVFGGLRTTQAQTSLRICAD